MASLSVTYISDTLLECATCLPAPVIVELNPGIANYHPCNQVEQAETWERKTIIATITSVIKRSGRYEYTLAYDSDDIKEGTLSADEIVGLAYYGALAKYAEDVAGQDSYIYPNNNGTYTYVSNHGCTYILAGGGGGDAGAVADTPSLSLELNEGVLSGHVKVSSEPNNALTLEADGFYAQTGWGVSGTSGTDPDENYLGTSDNIAFSIRANNKRALQILPKTLSPSILMGSELNTIGLAEGATIAGGGVTSKINEITQGNYAFIGGGAGNLIANGLHSFIGGGDTNKINSNSPYSVVVGGSNNTLQGEYSTIGGGRQNSFSTFSNYSVIAGGNLNTLSATYGTISGGNQNALSGNASGATVGGGSKNSVGGTASTISGGDTNVIITSDRATIPGGYQNTISSGSTGAVIGGGAQNTLAASSTYSVIAGGQSNRTLTSSILGATISGGRENDISSGSYSVIGGGQLNKLNAEHGVIAGGYNNIIERNHFQSIIVGGRDNIIKNVAPPDAAVNYEVSGILGGRGNIIDRCGAAVITGGRNNSVTQSTFSFIGAGDGNSITGSGSAVAIVSGGGNSISNSHVAFIGGGTSVSISGSNYSTASGGRNNLIDGSTYATIGGGFNNSITSVSDRANISGGEAVSLSGSIYASVGGGFTQTISSSPYGVISGGAQHNILNAEFASVGGGYNNDINGSSKARISGGGENSIHTNSHNSTIGGGLINVINEGQYSVVSGGTLNDIIVSNGATIAGGSHNRIHIALLGTIGGGDNNTIGTTSYNSNSLYSTIAGGIGNTIRGASCFIGGGGGNEITNNQGLGGAGHVICGGLTNKISGLDTLGSVIVGGACLQVGAYSFGFQSAATRSAPYNTAQVNVSHISSIAYFGDVDIVVGNTNGNPRSLRLYGGNVSGTYAGATYTKLSSLASLPQSSVIIFPGNVPVVGNTLRVTGVVNTGGEYVINTQWAN